MTAQHYNPVRTLRTVPSGCNFTSYRPLSAHKRAAFPVYYKCRRHLSDDVHSHKDSFETAADGRWSNRCNCCGLNSKGFTD